MSYLEFVEVTFTTKWEKFQDAGKKVQQSFRDLGMPELPEYNDCWKQWTVVTNRAPYKRKDISHDEAEKTFANAKKWLQKAKNKNPKLGLKLVKGVKTHPWQVKMPDIWHWEVEYGILSWETSHGVATVQSHPSRHVLAKVVSANCWDTDSDLPCIGMAGELALHNGTVRTLWGTRDVGMRTGHPPSLVLVSLETSALGEKKLSPKPLYNYTPLVGSLPLKKNR